MNDLECVHFLQWALPHLQMRWKGFRKVRRQVCRRLAKRLADLGLTDLEDYKFYLQHAPHEWSILDKMCRITISRFYRNRVVFDFLRDDIIPKLVYTLSAQHVSRFRVWSCGCASGEEPYTIALLWHFALQHLHAEIALEIIGTDMDPVMIERAKAACYGKSSLRNVPSQWIAQGFRHRENSLCLKTNLKGCVRFAVQDIRQENPEGPFHMILCRNLIFTYHSHKVQLEVLQKFSSLLADPGILVTGTHEYPLGVSSTFKPVVSNMPLYRKM